jgi:Txe/YoeB family toxin of Txe-Axe toxin-antitoxin module
MINNQSAAKRSLVLRSRDQYKVLDLWSESIVLITTSRSVAEYWARRVDLCEHRVHYDITDHDRRVELWQQDQRQ